MPRGSSVGHLRKKGKVWYFEMRYKGKRYYIRIGAVPKTIAREIAEEKRREIIRGEYVADRDSDVLFKEIALDYLEWYKADRHGSRKRTIQVQEIRVNRLIDFFGNKRLREINEYIVEKYKQKRLEEGVSKSTVNKELTILKAIFNKAKEWGIYKGAVPEIKKFKDKNERLRYLTYEEARKLIEACPEWFRPVIIFALNTGCRAGEIFSLKWDMVDFRARVLRIPNTLTKNKEVIKKPMNEVVYNLLKELKRKQEEKGIDHGYVFTNSKGLPYNYDDKTYRRVFTTACKKAGIENFRFHDLRHTFASWVAMQSKDIYAVKELLGHKDISMTKRYAHLTEDYLRQVVNEIADESLYNANITEDRKGREAKALSDNGNSEYSNWLREPEVGGSSPLAPWLREPEVGGSSPLSPTIENQRKGLRLKGKKPFGWTEKFNTV
ncbi:MAG: tyrosine-type recombinase/integrase [Aquificota bacterium]|nr:tyrosine-type recombinase/integrase [Aquificota bacterium]